MTTENFSPRADASITPQEYDAVRDQRAQQAFGAENYAAFMAGVAEFAAQKQQELEETGTVSY